MSTPNLVLKNTLKLPLKDKNPFTINEVLKLWKEFGSTVIFITHNIEEAIYLAERVLILTNKPAKIKESLQVDLPRPRNVTSDEFIELRKYVTDQIKWW